MYTYYIYIYILASAARGQLLHHCLARRDLSRKGRALGKEGFQELASLCEHFKIPKATQTLIIIIDT